MMLTEYFHVREAVSVISSSSICPTTGAMLVVCVNFKLLVVSTRLALLCGLKYKVWLNCLA